MRLADLPLILPAILLLPGMLPAQRIAIGEFALPDARSYPQGIALGPDGALWFTEWSAQKIARITPAGRIAGYPVTVGLGDPWAITAGPDGALWFTSDSELGRITTSGVLSGYCCPFTSLGITAGPDGAI